MRHVCATIVVVGKQWVLHNLCVCVCVCVCFCSLSYPTCNAHAPYCHLWPALLYNIFPHYLINGTIFEKKATEHKMCVLILSTNFVWNISHSKKKWVRYDTKCILDIMWSTLYSSPILMTLEFSQKIFEKSSNIKFRENPSIWRWVVPCRHSWRS
jgi:hypothetical protein